VLPNSLENLRIITASVASLTHGYLLFTFLDCT